MNILFVIRNWSVTGGAETVTVTLANEFVRRKHHIFVAYLVHKVSDPMPYTVDESIKAIKVPSFDASDEHSVRMLHGFLKENKVCIMINQGCEADYCRASIQDLCCKLITCWHLEVFPKFYDKSSKLKNFLCDYIHPLYLWNEKRWKMKIHHTNIICSDKYVFLASSYKNEFANYTHHKYDKKLHFIFNPLPISHQFDIDKYSTKKKDVIFVGRMVEVHKRMSHILTAWKNVCSNNEFSDWTLTMVGDGPDFEKTKIISHKSGLNNVRFVGFQNPIPYYEKASIFVMTSSSEGLAMTLLEAQQQAVVPIVMNTFSSLSDIVKDGYNGIVVYSENIEEFSDAIITLMKNKEEREQMAINGLSTMQKFSLASVADQWEELFKTLD